MSNNNASNNNKNASKNASFEGFAKTTARKGKGATGGYMVGLWQDKNGGGVGNHIKTSVLGIQNGQGFVFKVQDNKIVIKTLTQEQEKQAVAQGVGVFKNTTDGSNKWHNYTVVGNNALWGEMVAIIKNATGGQKIAYHKNTTQGQAIMQCFDVQEWGQE